MKKLTEKEREFLPEGRDLLIDLAAGPERLRYMRRTLIACWLQRLDKEMPDPLSTEFFLESVVFAAIHALANDDKVKEAHWLLDDLGTMEDIDGSRIAADPAICVRLSELRKSLHIYDGDAPEAPVEVPDMGRIFG